VASYGASRERYFFNGFKSIERTSAPPNPAYCPAIISNGDTQVTAGSWTLLHFWQVSTWVPVSRLPSAERHSETDICHPVTQERLGRYNSARDV
jgi:hypothetical protein